MHALRADLDYISILLLRLALNEALGAGRGVAMVNPSFSSKSNFHIMNCFQVAVLLILELRKPLSR